MVAKPARSPATTSRPRPEIHSLVGYVAMVMGAVLLFLGWYGASGSANVAEQIPYLASASIPGAALVIAGAAYITSDRTRRSNEHAAEMVTALYRLLTEAVSGDDRAEVAASDTRGTTATGLHEPALVQVSGGSRFHRPDCALVADKTEVETVKAEDIAERRLSACPICDPPTRAT